MNLESVRARAARTCQVVGAHSNRLARLRTKYHAGGPSTDDIIERAIVIGKLTSMTKGKLIIPV